GDTILDCKVRVGRNAIQYLQLAGRKVNLRTPIGSGKIVRIARVPYVLNPETGKRYEGTHRDDGVLTEMPIVPWLEPEINGVRYGDLIHPTTNPETLGKAISHGCVGTSEADAWVIYYNCPVGTKVNFRYQLKVVNKKGDTVRLKDIYKSEPKVLE
ncbi:MAG TPA: L,D-transpeptidase, partial [Cyclobacteriaceae bacterium]|nr:L,D-transpeptidase [Cyclobacteriaceae bacterium]